LKEIEPNQEEKIECGFCYREMLPDSMRIHSRKCNARNPQKPSKRRLRERRLNPPKKKTQSNRQQYQSNRQVNSNKGQKYDSKAVNMHKYKSQRNANPNGYGQKYKNKLSNSQRNQKEYSSKRKMGSERTTQSRQKQSNHRGGERNSNYSNQKSRKQRPKYDDFNDERSKNSNAYPPNNQRRGRNDMERPIKGNADMFKKMEMEGPPPPTSMSKCRVCGRTFASDRIAKHQKACVKASKKPKKIKRFHKTISKREKEKLKKSKPVPKWKQQHSEFIKQMKYMKKLKEVEDAGGDIRMLAPPPKSENPDLVPCKYCGRKFRDAAHERHENICQKVFGGKKGPTKKPSGRNIKKRKPSKGRRRY
jgi:hypothetical protein